MNEWYLRDCSRKQKAAYQVRGKSGKPTTNNVIYGYQKDPADKHHWLIVEEAAAIVRRIFRLSIEGHGGYEIAKTLREEQVECPSFYMAAKGYGCWKKALENWYGNTVCTILLWATRSISVPTRNRIRTKMRGVPPTGGMAGI